ncbi:MAG: tetratricopeptide repeat protein [Gemmatimonadetes bacterium]|uniref:Tetratricopeptide repeat protein n=1 Tax=Candidatus Kutchimonas denitrificans TaxID=3056748 RepID=A0AAE5CDT0_9BACT|nr:tetratricopeptide repeat protein [Gemmatimonadota bacterium]NIR76514.1 tetratricopeptide repeat protein [Candidatus Kutchimonas denitrificans]NIS03332.1 tetratricopeptide repeat protein [Gemmatimonadota bacterium]NIT69193.1 tetratricopeptide repeat protein [Gemmatimonadota bacterium]NIU54585.1 tetratricopeptide repeat protein [Gemmatimonadota bacterium]
MERFKQLVRELHRRSLWQVLAIYLVGAWIGYEVIQALTEGLQLPAWFPALALVLFIIGLPVVLATAFVQEGGPGVGPADPTLMPVEGEKAVATDHERHVLRRRLSWGNVFRAGVVVFALWGVFAAGWHLLGSGEDGERRAELSATAVAVMPFTFRGDAEYAYLAEGMVDLLSKALDGAGELRAVDAHALLSRVSSGAGDLGPSRAREVAQHFGAGLFVLGNVIEAGGRLRIDAALYDASGEQQLAVEATAEEERGVFELVDDLARQLVAAGGGGDAERLSRIAASTTGSLDALKAYLEGQRQFRTGQYGEAVEAYQQAVAADTAFALAYYRMSIAAEWVGQLEIGREASERAVRYAGRLPKREQRLLEASLALRRGDAAEAERLYSDVIAVYPEDVEAWHELGEVLFHHNPLRGRSFTESRAAFERVLELDPGKVSAVFHLARIAARERSYGELDSLVTRAAALQPESERMLELTALRAFTVGDSAERRSVVARARHASSQVVSTMINAAFFADELAGMREIAGTLTEPNRSRSDRVAGHMYVAWTSSGLGQPAAAETELSMLERLLEPDDLPVDQLSLGMLSAWPHLAPSRDRLEEIRGELLGWDPGTGPRPLSRADAVIIAPHLRLFLLGIVSLRLGDDDTALEYVAGLEGMDTPTGSGSLIPDLASTLRALVARERGRIDAALSSIEKVRHEVYYVLANSSPVYAQSASRFLRAELLAAAGRPEEAIGWYEASASFFAFDAPNLAPSHLRRAELYEELGDDERARLHYARFLELWQEPDPELLHMVESARHALERLTAEPGDG